MKTARVLIALIAIAVFSSLAHAEPDAPPPAASQPAEKSAPLAIQATFDILWKAILDNNQPAFVGQGDLAFRTAATVPVVRDVNAFVGPRAARGLTATYLGDMKAKGYRIDLWKLVFKDDGDDLLVSLSTKDGVVAGFFFR